MQGQLPPLTHLQFIALGALKDGEQPGRVIRDELARYGVRRTAAAFYQMMARLERARLVEGWYAQIIVGDQSVSERRYRLKPAGSKLWDATCAFYTRAAARLERVSDV